MISCYLVGTGDDGRSEGSVQSSDSRLGDDAEALYFVNNVRSVGAVTDKASCEATHVSQLIDSALLDSDGMLTFIDDLRCQPLRRWMVLPGRLM